MCIILILIIIIIIVLILCARRWSKQPDERAWHWGDKKNGTSVEEVGGEGIACSQSHTFYIKLFAHERGEMTRFDWLVVCQSRSKSEMWQFMHKSDIRNTTNWGIFRIFCSGNVEWSFNKRQTYSSETGAGGLQFYQLVLVKAPSIRYFREWRRKFPKNLPVSSRSVRFRAWLKLK